MSPLTLTGLHTEDREFGVGKPDKQQDYEVSMLLQSDDRICRERSVNRILADCGEGVRLGG